MASGDERLRFGKKDNACVDIRQYWKRPLLDESVPTKKGLCFRPQEFDIFLKHWEEIIKAMPELEKFSCLLRSS